MDEGNYHFVFKGRLQVLEEREKSTCFACNNGSQYYGIYHTSGPSCKEIEKMLQARGLKVEYMPVFDRPQNNSDLGERKSGVNFNESHLKVHVGACKEHSFHLDQLERLTRGKVRENGRINSQILDQLVRSLLETKPTSSQ